MDSAAVEIDHTYTQKVADAAVQVISEEQNFSEIVKGYVQCSFFHSFIRILCVTHPPVLLVILILGESQAKSLLHCRYKARGFYGGIQVQVQLLLNSSLQLLRPIIFLHNCFQGALCCGATIIHPTSPL